jgi:hypothetical protein
VRYQSRKSTMALVTVTWAQVPERAVGTVMVVVTDRGMRLHVARTPSSVSAAARPMSDATTAQIPRRPTELR